ASLVPSATGSTQPLSASAPRAGGSFEILPAPKPDLAAIPAHDLQAQALAKLRLNSRNSFLFVPRREGGPALPSDQSARPGPPPLSLEEKAPKEPLRASAPEQEEPVTSLPAPLDPLRYPTVNEIEVIGGYLSLERSCMSKTGSRRKKMKISFNETSLQTMFEYPSESSLAEEEEEEEDGHASEAEEDKSCTFYIPRPNSTLHPSTPNSARNIHVSFVLPADLSSYTPKHSVKFSEWQEQKYEEMPAAEGTLPTEADSQGNQVMLTPAEKGGLSDFSSEPALYF
ncbi:PREDICTED: taperin-like, partial [Chlamydotis macqueenii]|uniref:taperin-like n=1 Tax=Chlamydotis macqueenii TaxID=187382 RepID=UPI000529C819